MIHYVNRLTKIHMCDIYYTEMENKLVIICNFLNNPAVKIYIMTAVCVCVCVCGRPRFPPVPLAWAGTFEHKYYGNFYHKN